MANNNITDGTSGNNVIILKSKEYEYVYEIQGAAIWHPLCKEVWSRPHISSDMTYAGYIKYAGKTKLNYNSHFSNIIV